MTTQSTDGEATTPTQTRTDFLAFPISKRGGEFPLLVPTVGFRFVDLVDDGDELHAIGHTYGAKTQEITFTRVTAFLWDRGAAPRSSSPPSVSGEGLWEYVGSADRWTLLVQRG